MNAFAAIVFASPLSHLGYQMARSPVLAAFAADLGALPEFIGVIAAASTATGVLFKLPSDVLGAQAHDGSGRSLFCSAPVSLSVLSAILGRCSLSALFTALRPRAFRRLLRLCREPRRDRTRRAPRLVLLGQ
jgi:hypothetical protein